MGLLDSLKFSTGDPEKDAQLNRGLLQMGLQLMQSRGRLFPALGQAGMVGLQAADQTRQMQQQQRESEQMRQMRQLQIGQAQRDAQLAALPGQFYRAPSSPAMDATGGMETAVENPNNASGPGGFDMAGYIQALKGMAPTQAMQLEAMMAKPAVQPVVSKPGDVARDPKTGAILWQNPQEAKPGDASPLAKIVQEMNALPPDSPMRKVYQDMIVKMTTHQPAAVQNNFGSPVAGVDPRTGQPVFAFTNRTGDVKVAEGIRPPLTPAETKAAEDAANRSRQVQQMQTVMADARKILTQGSPTQSQIGQGIDAVGRVFGVSTIGAQSAAKLDALSGWLVANVPRMEGPQSDADVKNYQTMAGKVGDRNLPVAERLAALDTVEILQKKYADINPARQPIPGTAPAASAPAKPTTSNW